MITGSTFVPPAGDPLAPIVLVGEQPGRIEVKNRPTFRRPFWSCLIRMPRTNLPSSSRLLYYQRDQRPRQAPRRTFQI